MDGEGIYNTFLRVAVVSLPNWRPQAEPKNACLGREKRVTLGGTWHGKFALKAWCHTLPVRLTHTPSRSHPHTSACVG